MAVPKPMSLNTSLKNAMIFEEEDEDVADYSHLTFEQLIKKERIDSPPPTLPPVKEELDLSKVKSELIDFKLDDNFKIEPSTFKVKQEDSLDGFNISSKVAEMALKTPVKVETEDAVGKTNLRSAKRTLLRQRNSPYSKGESTTMQKRTPKKRELMDVLDEHQEKMKRMRTRSRVEEDPEVLSRRQKQIDFGKNTVGYDNYIKLVPKDKRTSEDPATPNKYRIYSRRGFDGLIKQWRLKLHKYDP